MPLSEEEQRILHEMEQKLYEHDRDFANRVSHGATRLHGPSSRRWWVVVFVAGFALLLATFRFSIALGAVGFFLMLASCLVLAQHVREGAGTRSAAQNAQNAARQSAFANDWANMRRKIRSRFGHRP